MSSERKFIGFQAPAEMYARLQQEAAGNDRSVSAELRRMVRQYLNEEDARPTEPDAFQNRAKTEPVGDKV